MDQFSLVLMKSVASYQNERALSLERKFSHLRCPEQKDSTALSLTCSATDLLMLHTSPDSPPSKPFVCSDHDTLLLKSL